MDNRIRRTNEEWLGLVKIQRASGQTMKEWCQQNNINLYTMADRVSRLRKDGLLIEPKSTRNIKSHHKSDWVEITAVDMTTPTSEINVTIGDFNISVSENFDEVVFSRICKALVSLC